MAGCQDFTLFYVEMKFFKMAVYDVFHIRSPFLGGGVRNKCSMILWMPASSLTYRTNRWTDKTMELQVDTEELTDKIISGRTMPKV